MRNRRTTRLLVALAAPALAACLCLTAGQAEAGPPRASDYGEVKANKAQCKAGTIVRRDSFQGVFLSYDSPEPDLDFMEAHPTLPIGDMPYLFRLPSGKVIAVDGCPCEIGIDETGIEQPGKSYLNKTVKVQYQVRRWWDGQCWNFLECTSCRPIRKKR